jgi:hypothetical protein
MDKLKKDLINGLIGNHLSNGNDYLERLYENVLNENLNRKLSDKDIINIIKISSYNDILILKNSNMKDYNKAVKELLPICRDKIKNSKY